VKADIIVDDTRVRMHLLKFSKAVPVATTGALDDTASNVVSDAKAMCIEYNIYDTGAFMKSISKEKIVKSGYVQRISVTVGGRVVNPKTGRLVDYAVYVHEGTSKMPARPVLRWAMAKNRLDLIKAITRGVMERMK
jgi:HK97 gp10 family phage protein